MGIVADVALVVGLHSIERDQHEANRVQPGRNGNWNGEDLDTGAAKQKYVGENDSAYAARSAVGAVFMMSVHIEGEQVSAQDRSEIDQKEMRVPGEALHRAAKQIQTEHVQQQMRPIRVQKARSNQPVVL